MGINSKRNDLHFDLKKHKTAGITYKNDGQILKSKIKDGKIVNSNITFKKSYKLQVRASKMMEGKKTIKKKTITYPITTTLLDAIGNASKVYKEMMIYIENDPTKLSAELNENMKFCAAFDAYVENKKQEYKSNSSKNDYNAKGAYAFYDKYLKDIHNKPINQIKPRDITSLKSKMVGKSDRTKLCVHQYVNPVYVFINDNSEDNVKSPAKIHKKDRNWDNTRDFNLSTDEIKKLFKQLKNYPASPFRELFMWLMHGRRRNEVLSLQWSDIDLTKKTYTIQATNNKARISMTYKLTDRLLDTLNVLSGEKSIKEMKGNVFRGIKNKEKALDITITRKHWIDLETGIVLHQIRSCIVHYLKNVHNVSNELSGFILGHTQSSTVTERYGVYGYDTLNDALSLMLDDVFDDVKPVDDKLKQLQALFPNKTKEQLEVFLNDI